MAIENKPIDLSGEADVYADVSREIQLEPDKSFCVIQVTSEASPTALGRIFNVLSILSIVPLSSKSIALGHKTISLNLELFGVDPRTIELLRRKITQLTETLTITIRYLKNV